MAVLFSERVVHVGLAGTTEVSSGCEWERLLATAERLYFEVRISQVTGTSPAFTMELKHSNSGQTWATKASLFASQVLTKDGMNYLSVTDTNAAKALCARARLTFKLEGTGTLAAQIEIWATGRDDS